MVTILKQRRDHVSPKNFGAIGNTRSLNNTSITAGSNVVTNTVDAPFMRSDVGAYICLVNAGASAVPLSATVASYVSASQITISVNAVTTQTNGRCVVGNDDSTAITAALNYIAPKAGFYGGSNLFLGDGHYLTGPQTLATGCAIYGGGPQQSMLYLKPNSASSLKFLIRNRTSDANRQSYEDFGINGLRDYHVISAGTYQRDVNLLYWGPDPDSLSMVDLDVYNRYRNLLIKESPRAGISYSGRGESKFSDISIIGCTYAYEINAYDNVFEGCHGSAYAAAWLLGSSCATNRFVGCKGYYSGYFGGDGYGEGDNANWCLNGATHNDFVGCEGQESWGANWILQSNAKWNTFTACRAGDPGCVYPAHGSGSNNASAIRAGFYLKDSSQNKFVNCNVSIETHLSNSYASHAVYLAGTSDYNAGNIFTDNEVTYATAKVGNTSSGTNNKLAIDDAPINADVLRAAQDIQQASKVSAINTKTANYTLVLADAGTILEMNVSTANTVSIPPNSSVAFPVKTKIEIVQYGAGQVTIAAGAGVTIRSLSGNLKISGQYGRVTLYQRAANEWVLTGNLSA